MRKQPRVETTKITFVVSTVDYNDVDIIMEEHGFLTRSDTLRSIFRAGKMKLLPAYVKINKQREDFLGKTPEERLDKRAQLKVKEKSILKDIHVAEKYKICDMLEGTVSDINSIKHCTYKTYNESGGGVIEVGTVTEPLETLTSESVDLQYKDILGEYGPEITQNIKSKMNK